MASVDILNIFVIVNYNNFSKQDVIAELKAEGYQHNFTFGIPGKKLHLMKQCDEVWTFGECVSLPDYQMAQELGKDIWKMG